MDGRELLKRRLLDLDRTAYERNILRVCGFLSPEEQCTFHQIKKDFLTRGSFLYGGYEDAERKAAFFPPDYMEMDAAVKEAIRAVRFEPLNGRFSEELSHRDYLGALMNLGIERDRIGDILIDKQSCVVFTIREMAPLIKEELVKVKHTSVAGRATDPGEAGISIKFVEIKANVGSERADAVIAAVLRISRQRALDLVKAERVYLNGETLKTAGKALRPGDRVSVRGWGKFIYDGVSGKSRKGRLYADIRKFA